MTDPESGYTACACRDCMEITISNDMKDPDLCWECEEAGCEKRNGECRVADTFPGSSPPPPVLE